MINTKKRTYFTLVEVMISVAIIALLFSMLAFLMRNQIRTFFKGNRAISVQQETQLIMKQLFIDLKRINTRVYVDGTGDIIVHGEKYKNIMPSFVYLIDTTAEKPFCEALEYSYYEIDPLGKKHTVRYYLDGTQLMRKHETDGKSETSVISSQVKEIYFRKNIQDNKSFIIFVETVFNENESQHISESHTQFEMNMRIDNDLVAVQRKTAYDS